MRGRWHVCYGSVLSFIIIIIIIINIIIIIIIISRERLKWMVNKGLKGFKKYITQSLTINFLAFYEWSVYAQLNFLCCISTQLRILRNTVSVIFQQVALCSYPCLLLQYIRVPSPLFAKAPFAYWACENWTGGTTVYL